MIFEDDPFKAVMFCVICVFILTMSVIVLGVISIDSDKWCEKKMPMMNTSMIDGEKVAYCYGEGWVEYCKISYPENCPKVKK